MPWPRVELTDLVTRVGSDITARFTGGVSLLRRSSLAIIARVVAAVTHTVHGFIAYCSRQTFVRTAEESWLDEHANQWDVPRLAASFAQGSVTFTGTNDSIIPAGTIVVRSDGTEYTTDAEGIIESGSVIVAVTCSVASADGNYDAGEELSLASGIEGVDATAVVYTGGLAGGTDLETDEALRLRVLDRIQYPPTGGSSADYRAWAKSISGIAKVWVLESYYGLGSVAVVVTGIVDLVVASPLLAEVQAYIDEERPVTAAVTVVAVDPIEIEYELAIKPNTQATRDAVTAALEELFEADGEPGGTLLLSHVNEAILTSGLQDFSITSIDVDGAPAAIDNVTLTGFEYPTLGTITFTTLS